MAISPRWGCLFSKQKKAPSHLCQPLTVWLVLAAVPCIPKTYRRAGGNPQHYIFHPTGEGVDASAPEFHLRCRCPGRWKPAAPGAGHVPGSGRRALAPREPHLALAAAPGAFGGPGSRLGPVAVPDVLWGHGPTFSSCGSRLSKWGQAQLVGVSVHPSPASSLDAQRPPFSQRNRLRPLPRALPGARGVGFASANPKCDNACEKGSREKACRVSQLILLLLGAWE